MLEGVCRNWGEREAIILKVSNVFFSQPQKIKSLFSICSYDECIIKTFKVVLFFCKRRNAN